jgi:predicted MPP superfamily phosphohydrolase
MLKLILLIVTVFSTLLASHYAIHTTIVRALKLSDAPRRALLGVLLVLALSFPVSLILLLRGWDNGLSRGLFLCSSVWLGLAINLLLAAGLCWLLVGASRLAKRPLALRPVALVLGAAALLFSAWGTARALFPTVHRLEVSLKGLPDSWEGKTLVHLSDIHLGAIHGPGFMARIVEETNALDPELVLITGDLFDAPGGDYEACLEAIGRLRARRGVFLVAGNHEVINPKAGSALKATGLRILDREVVQLDGLQLLGVGYPGLSGEEGARTLARLRRELTPTPSILLFHTPTSILQRSGGKVAELFETYWGPDTSCAVNRELGVDLQLSGHTHAGQIFPFGLATRLIYRGRDRGLVQDGPFQLYVSSGTGTFGPPLRTAGRSEVVALTLRRGGPER